MIAATISSHGGLDKLQVHEMPTPECPTDQVKVKVLAAALNHLDLFVCKGWSGLKLNFPHILGSDACGEVVEIGTRLIKNKQLGYRVGDRVILHNGIPCGDCEFCRAQQPVLCVNWTIIGEQINGAYAETLVAPPAQFYKLPKHLNAIEGAALTLTYLTAWRMLTTQAQIKKGESVLIVGIGGGVAQAAFQLALHMGCKVMVTSRSQAKIDQALELGASHGFVTSETLAREVRLHTAKRGVDVVVESVGEKTWSQSLQCLRRGGRLVTCGATSGPNAITDINRLFWNQLKIYGSTMGSREEWLQMLTFVSKHKIKPVIDKVFPLAEAKNALAHLESGDQLGKIVLQIANKVS